MANSIAKQMISDSYAVLRDSLLTMSTAVPSTDPSSQSSIALAQYYNTLSILVKK